MRFGCLSGMCSCVGQNWRARASRDFKARTGNVSFRVPAKGENLRGEREIGDIRVSSGRARLEFRRGELDDNGRSELGEIIEFRRGEVGEIGSRGGEVGVSSERDWICLGERSTER